MTEIHPAFETVSESDLPEYRARGILLRHRATGCEVFRLEAADPENVFAFAFRTRPGDSTGVAHIVEHSVLCGSERFPVKDSFLVMARRSLATFMNAFTYPDKTVYPAASAVEADYFNLMDVYGDAVFFPRLTEDTFLQEAHHLEVGDDGRLDIAGVVYNEMRGDYSSSESLASTASYTSLFSPGHPYSFDSGGDPEAIPSLTYEGFKDFWARHYHPSNCRVFLYGDIDTARQLDFLDSRFLSRFGRIETDSEIPLEPILDAPRRIEVPYPLAEGADAATSIVVNWLTAPIDDGASALAMEVISELLLGHDGSPLSKALRESGLGEDLSPQCGLDTGFRQIIFSAGLRGARRGGEAEVEALILETIKAQVESGFKKEALDAALHSIAFSNREIRRGSGAYGMRLFNRAARGWLHGAGPEATLSFERPMAELRARLDADPRFLEGLADRLILSNGHRRTITVYPDPGLLERNRDAREARLAERARGLSQAELAALRARAAELAAAQARPDAPEAVATLPRLSRRDIPRAVEPIRREKAAIGGVDASLHPVFTNGIVYLDLAFPLDSLPRGLLPWMPLFARFVAGAGIPGVPYDEMAARLARCAGGFSAVLESGTPTSPTSPAGGESAGAGPGPGARSFAVFRLKALEERFPEALELVLSLLSGADFGDERRISDVLAELRNDVVSALVPAGNAFALARAHSGLGEALAVEDLWRGTSQVEFVSGLRGAGGPEIPAVAEALRGLARSVLSREGLRANLTAEEGALGAAAKALGAAIGALPGRSSPPAGAGRDYPPAAGPEAYSISSQVGFAAAACRSSRLGESGFGHETILAHYLSTGPLWEELRVRRGAYGASCAVDGLEGAFGFSSYRDPRPVDALAFFGEALEKAAAALSGPGGEAAVEEAAVGAIGRDLRPLLPEERGYVGWRRELYGITDALRQAKRDEMLGASASDVAKAASRIAEAYRSASAVLISGSEDVKLLSRVRSGVRVAELPA
jgi:presequence protease